MKTFYYFIFLSEIYLSIDEIINNISTENVLEHSKTKSITFKCIDKDVKTSDMDCKNKKPEDLETKFINHDYKKEKIQNKKVKRKTEISDFQSKSFDYIDFQTNIIDLSENDVKREPNNFFKKWRKRTLNFFNPKRTINKNTIKPEQNFTTLFKNNFVSENQISDLYSINRARTNNLSNIENQVNLVVETKQLNEPQNFKDRHVEDDISDSVSYESISNYEERYEMSNNQSEFFFDKTPTNNFLNSKKDHTVKAVDHIITCSCQYINCELIKKINNLLSQDKNDFDYRLYWVYKSKSDFKKE